MTDEALGFIHEYQPAAEGGPALTLLLLHGTGGSERDLLGLGRMLARGAALLSPRGKVDEQGMARFFRRLAPGVFDVEDLRFRVDELADFVSAAVEAYGLDKSRVVGVGYSNGANTATAMLLLRPESLAAAILLRPMVPLVPEVMPELRGKPVFVSAGLADPLVPRQEVERVAELLRSAGAVVSVHWHAGGHAIAGADVAAGRAWLERAVLPFVRG